MLYNPQEDNLTRRNNNCKCLCTQHEAPKYIKQLITNIKELIDSNIIIVGDINTTLISMDTSSKQNKQGSNDFEWHTGTDGLNRYIQNIPS